jgi:glycosyltransferase involved in cell wall biosynthesis
MHWRLSIHLFYPIELTMIPSQPPIRVALFAYNEQKTIERSLTHLMRELKPFADAQVRVLINGCTDKTADVVQSFAARQDGRVVAFEFAIGDKATTWNRYLTEVSRNDPDKSVQIFMDADIWPEPGSIQKMALALDEMPNVAVIGGLPMCGRNRDRYRKLAIEKNLLYGGIYATRGSWLAWARSIGYRIPSGLIAEDSALTNAFTTLPNNLRKSNLKRIHHLPDCGYRFEPIRPWRPADLMKYLRRSVRYRLGSEQLRIMGWRWPDEMPENTDELNQAVLDDLRRNKRMSLIDYRLRKHLERQCEASAA